ncbi:MAG TPA: dephospho-CoA kinase [Erysipelotrichaceae bacterium]|nr:dephospho-CoA kinase [Erysipelotrichaceae bacterium]
MRIAITGSIGSGKSEAGKILKELGYTVIDTDALAHRTLTKDSDVYASIVKEYGNKAIGVDGNIDRRFLADLIFADPQEKKKVEGWMHPVIWRMVDEECEKHRREDLVFVEVPLLFETGSQTRFDRSILILTTQKTAVARLMRHRKISQAEARRRWKSQMDPKLKARFADEVIRNDESTVELKLNLLKMIEKLKKNT